MIVFDQDGWRFNYRVAGILLDHGRVLLERDLKSGDCCLPGGRVEFGESASEAIVREMREELGVEAQVERLVWAVDNFFQMDSRRYHELSFYFLITRAPRAAVPLGCESFPNKSTTKTVLQWRALENLNAVPLYPTFLRQELRALPKEAAHRTHRDTPLSEPGSLLGPGNEARP